ncbi:MAG TPA: hypothetical protein VGN20_06055 [Mucilaginibacter sp.]|jgi:hypothetical protein
MPDLKGLITAVFLILSLNGYAQPSKEYLERKAVIMVENLKEVKQAKMYFKRTGSPLHVLLEGMSGKDYLVRAAQIKGERTFTYYWFYVDPTKNTIRYWDIPMDTTVSITQWRKNNHEIDHPKRKKAPARQSK